MDRLPDEALVRLFSYVPAKELVLTISIVCKRFNEIIFSEWFWKRRFHDVYGGEPFLSDSVKNLQLCGVEGEYPFLACSKSTSCMDKSTVSSEYIENHWYSGWSTYRLRIKITCIVKYPSKKHKILCKILQDIYKIIQEFGTIL